MAQYNFKQIAKHSDNKIPDQVAVAVIGAGVSGLYSTWKILEDDPTTDICILDQIGRIGGRLDSDVIKIGDQEVKEEEGGMRFTFDLMDNLMALLMKLDLTDDIVPFPMNSGGNNRLYFRGHAFTNSSAAEDDFSIWSELYQLEAAEQGINPKSIINTVFNRILDVNPDFTPRPTHRGPEFWQRFRLECKWKDVSLKDWQLQGLLADMGYSTEIINLLYRLSGFNGTFLSDMNAGIAYQLLEEFPADPKFKTLKRGFSSFTNGMVEQIQAIKEPAAAQAPQRIFLLTTVDGIDYEAGEFIINYTQRSIETPSKIHNGKLRAQKVILGLPRLALEKLFIGSSIFDKLDSSESAQLWNRLQSTSNQPLVKINLYYDRAWWGTGISGQPAVEFGPNFSDTPMGSVYPFYSINEELAAALEYAKWLKDNDLPVPASIQKIIDSKYHAPAALTIYCDYMNVNYWKALQNVGKPYLTELQKEHPKLLPASESVVEKATAYFKQLFNTHYVPRPTLTSARIWSGSSYFPVETAGGSTEEQDKNTAFQPYGYGVHQWGMGAQDDEIIQQMVQPIADYPLYTCGESFSDYQGWVEGALRSTNLVLEKFGIASAKAAFMEETGQEPNPAIKKQYWEKYQQIIETTLPDVDPDFKNAKNPYLLPDGEEDNATEQPATTEVDYGVNLEYLH